MKVNYAWKALEPLIQRLECEGKGNKPYQLTLEEALEPLKGLEYVKPGSREYQLTVEEALESLGGLQIEDPKNEKFAIVAAVIELLKKNNTSSAKLAIKGSGQFNSKPTTDELSEKTSVDFQPN